MTELDPEKLVNIAANGYHAYVSNATGSNGFTDKETQDFLSADERAIVLVKRANDNGARILVPYGILAHRNLLGLPQQRPTNPIRTTLKNLSRHVEQGHIKSPTRMRDMIFVPAITLEELEIKSRIDEIIQRKIATGQDDLKHMEFKHVAAYLDPIRKDSLREYDLKSAESFLRLKMRYLVAINPETLEPINTEPKFQSFEADPRNKKKLKTAFIGAADQISLKDRWVAVQLRDRERVFISKDETLIKTLQKQTTPMALDDFTTAVSQKPQTQARLVKMDDDSLIIATADNDAVNVWQHTTDGLETAEAVYQRARAEQKAAIEALVSPEVK